MMNRNMKIPISSERGSVGGWIFFWIIIIVVIGAAVYAGLINQKIVPAPPFLANQPWMQGILPKPEVEEEPTVVEMSAEDTLRNQVLILNSQLTASDARAESLEEELAGKEREIQDLNDQIAQLQNTINLARTQNISNVALIYENMDPQDAAVFLTNLGPDQASLILAKMRESKAADVLALMDDTIATQITQLLAGFEQGSAGTAGSAESQSPQTPSPVTPAPPAGTPPGSNDM